MRRARLVQCLSCAALLFAFCTGCQTLEGRRPVSVQVIDADSKQPIPQAQTRVSYPLAGNFLPPGPSSGRTGNSGVAQLSASAHTDTDALLEVYADGYIAEHRFLTVEKVREIKSAGLFESLDKRPANFIVEVYSDQPLPTVELVAPTGYHGVLQLEFQIPEDAPGQPGQRQFTFAVPPSGLVCVTGPAVLRRFPAPIITAKFADGGPISLKKEMEDWETGLWTVKFETKKSTYFVGTKSEFAQYRLQHPPENNEVVRSTAGGKGGGGGKGRGRRGAGQVDPGPDQP
jgi:hypothetical protein